MQILSNFVNNTMFWVIKFEWSSDFQYNWNIWLGFPKDAPFRASVKMKFNIDKVKKIQKYKKEVWVIGCNGQGG